MSVLVNFKICDNAKECSGVAVCPVGAIYFDEEKETLAINNDKCISCGLCERECPIGAISVAKTEEEYNKIKEEIDNDPRTIKDLFVDRYGAAPLSEFFIIEPNEVEEKINSSEFVLAEVYQEETIECLLKSIPIKELTKDLPDTTLFFKVECDETIKEKYELKEFPSMLVFQNGKLAGKIEGYYTTEQKEEVITKLKQILNIV